jgi:error-prone DNA polymerase
VAAAASYGAGCAAITDRDGLYGAVRHIRACLAANISPIVGVNIALAAEPDTTEPTRITVLAHGATQGHGWASLARMITAAHGRSAKTKPVLARTRLNGLLCGPDGVHATVLLGPESDVGRHLARGNHKRAETALTAWKKLLPGGICVDVVCHFTEPGSPASLKHAVAMLELAVACDVPAVLTNAVRYLTPDDALTGDVLDAAEALRPLGLFPPQPNGQAWLKPPATMHQLAHFIVRHSSLEQSTALRLLAHTERLAALCALDPETDIGWRQAKIPENDVIGLTGDPNRVLWQSAESAIAERYPYASTQLLNRVRSRMGDELHTISGFGFASYFLTVADVSALIRRMGIRNQARGSGAGSIVNYLLRISNVDPRA